MLDIPIGFVHVANAITDRIAELLCAPVFVIDRKGIVITSSEPHHVGRSLRCERSEPALSQFLRIPLRHEAETGEVIVGKSQSQEPVSLRLAHALVELVINQTVTQNRVAGQHGIKNQLIYDLVHGQVNDELETLSQARQLGMDLTQPRAVILIDAADYILRNVAYSTYRDLEMARKRRAQVVIGSIVSFFHLPNDTICADLGSGNICVLKASNTKNLDAWASSDDVPEGANPSWANLSALKRAAHALLQRLCSDLGASINIGIGRYHPGLQGLAQSHEDARAALSLGNRLQGQNRVHCLAELGIAAFVGIADEDTKIDLAKYLLSPLDREPELLTTLNTFFSENCCPSSTAKKLSIHRNTLSYRLDKITSLTGLEPRKFDDAVQMRLSILLRSLQAA
jgi:carbohydrate diacid regulator